jgi:hypothetical protein
MRLVGPWPCIANGTITMRSHRNRDDVTIFINDELSTGLDEISVHMVGITTAEADAFEEAVKAFNNALAMAKAREAA